jgi:hypothetical protein
MSNIKKGSKLTVSTANGISRDISNNLGVLEISGPGMINIAPTYGSYLAHLVIGATDVSGILQLGINQDGNTFIDANININHKDIIMQKYGGNLIVGSGVGSISKVGIQTDQPSSTFHINSTDGIIIPVGTDGQRPVPAYQGMMRYNTTTSQFEGYGPGDAWGSLGGVKDVDGDTYILAETSAGADNDALQFYTAGQQRLEINSAGNVGIGVGASSSYKLNVNGQLRAMNLYVADKIYHEGDPNTYMSFGSDNWKVVTYDIDRLVVNNTGVGIGRSPSYSLDVNGTAYFRSTTYLTSTTHLDGNTYLGGNYIYRTTSATSKFGFLGANQFGVATNSNWRFNIDAVGNVGIGTTSPYARLEVTSTGSHSVSHIRIGDGNHNGSASHAIYPVLTYYARTNAARRNTDPLFSGSGNTGGCTAAICFTDRPGTYTYASAVRTSDITFYTALSTIDNISLGQYPRERMRITAEGNVGIGTTSPGEKLEVNGNIKLGSSNGTLITDNQIYRPGNNAFHIQYGGSGDLTMCYGGGNVGIGTTSPNEKLEIIGGGVRITWTSSLFLTMDHNQIYQTGGSLFLNYTTQNNVIICGQGGNVGIGTTSPTRPLHIATTTTMPSSSYNLLFGSKAYGWYGSSTQNWYSHSGGTHRPLSIYSAGGIWIGSGAYFASSDRRIKTNIVDVSDNLALEMVRNIPCRYYEYKDKLIRGTEKTIGFIAQDVKEVLPMAVSLQKNIIPNEMRSLTEISWNDTTLYTDLSDCSGIKYRFYVGNDVSGNDEIRKEVIGNSDNSFTFDTSYNNVFCYGKEVDDFHTIDKNKLYTINFSATQEIDRIQQQEITKVQSIQTDLSNANTTIQQQATKITTLETQIADILTRLSNLENTGSS